MKKKLLKTLLVAVGMCAGVSGAWADVVVPTPVYAQDFEEASTTQGTAGNNFGISGATLTGSGVIRTGDALFGQYYQNMPDAIETTKNTNFLTLTTNAFTTMQNANVKTVTISFWINAFNSTLSTDWASIFVAYGETGNANHNYPYGFDIRNTLAVHTNVWRAFYHDNGSQNSSWLSKGASLADSWHHVAVVYTEDRNNTADVKLVVKQYVDGTLKQSFSLTNGWDGDNIGNRAYSLLDDMGRLTEFCIGGNSSENWGDKDNQYAYDEIAIYNVALSETQINQIRTNKLNRTVTGTQIGLKSNGSGYVTEGAMTDKVTLKPGDSYHYNFINYNRGINNWNNFVVPVWDATDTRVITVRADNWEDMHHEGDTWGSNAGCTSNFSWTNFPGNMNGAAVDMTVTFTTDKKFNMSSSITTIDGSEWTYSYTNDYTSSPINLSDNSYIKVALAVSHSWLDLLEQGQKNVGVTIPTSGYGSLASAYGLNFAGIDGLTAYVATKTTNDYVTLTSVDEIAASQGMILKGTPSSTYSIPVKATAATPATNYLSAAVTATPIEANTAYILQSGELHLVTEDSTVPAGKAYLLASNVPAGARAMGFVFDDDEPTGISSVDAVKSESSEFFNLKGQRVAAPQKGIYIVNGKKVIFN